MITKLLDWICARPLWQFCLGSTILLAVCYYYVIRSMAALYVALTSR